MPFGEAEAGASGLELLLPLTLKWATEQGISVSAAIARITQHPAKILGLDAGHLASGHSADVCIFNPETRWQVVPAVLQSQGKNTPFLGYEMQGAVMFTLVEGQVVFERKN